MNKLFTKVAALTLGVAMAAGVGVALGSAKASEAKADTQNGSIDLSSASTNTGDGAWDISHASGYYANNNGAKLDSSGEYILKNGIFSGVASSGMTELVVEVNGKINGDAGATNSYKVEALNSSGSAIASEVKTGASVFGTSFGKTTFTMSSGLANCTGIKVTYVTKGSGNLGVKGVSWTATYSGVAPTTFTVTYNGNGATSGTAPVDSTVYDADNNQVTVLPAGDLEKTNFTFGGWTDGTSTFAAGDTFTISNNVTLNAVWVLNTEHAGTQEDPYSIADARLAIDNGGTVNQVYVTGIISQIDKFGSSGGIIYWISDDGTTTNQFEVYYGNNIGNVPFSALTDISLGATVVNFGNITKYNSTYEFSNGSYLTSYVAPANPSIALSVDYLAFIAGGDAQSFTVVPTSFSDVPTVTIEGASHVQTAVDGLTVSVLPSSVGNDTLVVKATNGTEVAQIELDVRVFATHGHVENDPYTVAEALALIASDTQYIFRDCYVKGLISQVASYNSTYHSLDYDISDNGEKANELLIYSGKGLNGADFNSKDDLTVGYEVVVKGNLKYYSGTSEMDKNSVQISYKAPAPTLESIAVSGEYKTKYGYQAEEFDKEGIVVTATYSDQSQQPVDLTDVEFSGYDKSVLGEQTITVTYQEKTTTFKVTVYYTATYKPGEGTSEDGDYVEYIENPDNYELVSFEQTGFVAPTGKQFKEWSQGTTGKVAVSANGNLNFTAVYEDIPVQKFTITYKAGYGTGDDIVISDVEAGSSHTLKEFAETQFVAPAGQQFKGWRVGSETELRDPGYQITNIQADVNIFANYEDIPVTDWSDAFKTAYTSRFGSTLPPFVDPAFAGDENTMYWFDGYPFGYVSVEGNLLSVAISAFNGQWQFVGDAQNAIYIFCDANMNAFVQIVYDQDYGTTDLVFSAIGALALDTTNVKTEYFVGDAVDTTNLTVHPRIYNGTVVPALQLPSTMWTVSPSTFTEAGTQNVTVTVPDFFTEPVELTYSVNVTAVVAESISVSGQATKTSYKAGEEWSAEGLVVTAHYNNGTEADVTDQVTWSFDPAETAAEVTSVSAVAHLGDLSSDAFAFNVVVEQSYDADAFAKDLLEMVAPICANYDGKKNNKAALKTVWDTMSQRYSTLSNEEKAKVIAAAAKADGTDLEKAMAFYNYACKKYGLTKFIEGRQVKALVAEHETGNSILPIVVIVASSVAAITAIGVVIALKRRKALLAK